MALMGLPVTSAAFVGRRAELERIGAMLAAASDGRSGALFLEAGAGVGASRLLDEAERRLAGRGPILVLRGRGRDTTRGDAFAPAVEAIFFEESAFVESADLSNPCRPLATVVGALPAVSPPTFATRPRCLIT